MRKIFLIFSAFALIVSMTVCASHTAHASDTGADISINIDVDGSDDNSLGSNSCDIACGGCCFHHVIHTTHIVSTLAPAIKEQRLMPNTNLFVSDLIYGLKRPPKS